MLITHLGHAAVLAEIEGTRILIDPGNFSDAWHGLTDLDAVFVTHQHPDHIDPVHVPALLEANPNAVVHVEDDVLRAHSIPRAKGFPPNTHVDVGPVRIKAVGGRHAIIHPDIPQIGNIGLVVTAAGEPTLFHPGDSLAATPDAVDVLAIPAYGPWAAMKETVDFVRAVNAPHGFLIHQGLLNDRGIALIESRIPELTATVVNKPIVGEAWNVA